MLLILHSASATYLFISQWDHSIPLIFLIVSKLPLLFRFHFITWSHFCLSACVMETSHLRNLSLIYFICWKCYNMEKVSVACIHIIYVEFTLHYNHFTITSRQWIDAKYTCYHVLSLFVLLTLSSVSMDMIYTWPEIACSDCFGEVLLSICLSYTLCQILDKEYFLKSCFDSLCSNRKQKL